MKSTQRKLARIIDDCQGKLHAGWFMGDMRSQTDAGMVWFVFAHRHGEQVVAKATRQAVAWKAGFLQAEAVDRRAENELDDGAARRSAAQSGDNRPKADSSNRIEYGGRQRD
jgi:hypothetical protein